MVVLPGQVRGGRRMWRPILALLFVFTLVSIPAPVAGEYIHTRLNASLTSGEQVSGFAISPDGEYVVYTVYQERPSESSRLYSVPISGGESVRLDQPSEDGAASVYIGFQISPDSRHVVYDEVSDSDGRYPPESFRLYSVPIGGGVPVWLDPQTVADVEVRNFKISSDSAHVVYLNTIFGRGQDRPATSWLYSVPISGGGPIQLNTPAIPGVGIDTYPGFQISPDSAHVVYTTQVQDAQRDDPHDIYTVPISGGTPVKLPLPDEFLPMNLFSLSPDSRYIVVLVAWGWVFELYSFPIEGGAPIRLSNAYELSNNTDWGSFRYLLSADGKDVIYPLWDDARKRDRVVRVPAGGGERIELTAGTSPAQDLVLREMTADGEYVLYTGYDRGGTTLYSAPMGGGAPVQLLVFGGDESWIPYRLHMGPAGNRVVVQRDEDPDLDQDVLPLVSISAQGGAPTVLVNRELSVSGEKISPDGSQVFYMAEDHDDNTDDRGFFSVSITGGTPVRIGMPVHQFEISPDGKHVVYQQDWHTDLYVCTTGFSQYLPYVHRP